MSLDTVPAEDPAVYDMICRADTVGVFQIESRAQMSMLPRLRPRCFYDLVIEVAIVRPGPIQGGMVHPYLRRRSGEEAVIYPNEAIKEVLKRTLGVPLFQEQAMRLAVVAAGFTPGEADQLRRAMGAWRRDGDITRFRTKLIDGMRERGLSEEFAERCFKQICGFGEYGFPESHAASFALLVYVSCWLKRYHPAGFCAALLNAQPMGFYQPAQLVRDAREHGVTVLGVDVNMSGYDCRLVEERDEGTEGRRDEGTKGRRDEGTNERDRGIKGSRDQAEKSKWRNVEMAPGGVGRLEPRAQATGSSEPRPSGSGQSVIRCTLSPKTEESRGSDEGVSIASGQAVGRSDERTEERSDAGDGCHGQAQRRRVGPHNKSYDRVGPHSGPYDTAAKPAHDDPSTWGVGGPALRLGMRLIHGVSGAQVEGLEAAQRDRPFTSVADLARRSGAALVTLFRLAGADGMRSLGLDRRQAVWEVLALGADPQMFEEYEPIEPTPDLPEMSLEDTVRDDYSTIGLSLAAHPMSLIRSDLARLGAEPTRILKHARHGQHACVAGMVLVRQRPSTASGVVFCTLEDETGIANLIIRPQYYEKYRRTARGAAVLIAKGRVERQGEVVHLNVTHLIDASRQASAKAKSRDFH